MTTGFAPSASQASARPLRAMMSAAPPVRSAQQIFNGFEGMTAPTQRRTNISKRRRTGRADCAAAKRNVRNNMRRRTGETAIVSPTKIYPQHQFRRFVSAPSGRVYCRPARLPACGVFLPVSLRSRSVRLPPLSWFRCSRPAGLFATLLRTILVANGLRFRAETTLRSHAERAFAALVAKPACDA